MGGRGKGQYELVFDDLWDSLDRLDEHLCAEILGSSEAISEWKVEKGYLDWFLTISHPYVSRQARVHAPRSSYTSSAYDHGLDSTSCNGKCSRVAESPCIGPLGKAPDFPSIYERGDSSRTSTADTEAGMREAERAESVMIAAEQVSQQPGISIRDPLICEASRVEL
ncbi:hypothetical protein V2J09_020875 [Rumex salicifolius]